MKINRKVLALLIAFIALAVPSFAQQNLLVQTTLAAGVPIPSTSGSVTGGPAATPGVYGLVQVASATGITAYTLNPTSTLNAQQLWVIYVDREEMAVIQVNGTSLYTIRGYNSTVATSHASGAMVLYGKAAWFYNIDPGAVLSQGGAGVSGGTSCTAASVFVTPWLNVRNGAQWLCSSITGTWVPGFNNPMAPSTSAVTVAVASVAGSTLPSGPLFHVTGTNAITGWTIPVGCNATAVGGCQFTIIPDAVFSWTAAGNIAIASTSLPALPTTSGVVTVGIPITFIWDATSSKWRWTI